MDKVFVDTDIALDMLTGRHPFYAHAAHLFTLSEKGSMELYVSVLSINNLNYMLSKQYNRAMSRQILSRFRKLVRILSVDDNIIDLALHSSFPDFEDAIQYYTAIGNNIPVIVTRNIKDYRHSAIPVMTAEIYLKGIADK